ncbi:hypothetical protein RBB80_19855 [Tunturiibacter gelidiferens]
MFACFTSFLVLHEHLGRRSLLGAVLILTGIGFIELFPSEAPIPTYPT